MKRYEVKYFNLEFPPVIELNLPFIEPPETKSDEELAKLQADSQVINEYFFPGLSEVLMAVEFVSRNRYARANVETMEHVEFILKRELQARENFPETAYFRGAQSMLELHRMLPRVGDRVRTLTKRNMEADEVKEDPVLTQLQYAIEFHSLMIDIQIALAGIQNQKLEKELSQRNEVFYQDDPFDLFVPATEFADFSLTEQDAKFSNEEVESMFLLASLTPSSTWDLDFFQKVAEMLRSQGVDVQIEVSLPMKEVEELRSVKDDSSTHSSEKKKVIRKNRRKPRNSS